MGASCFGGGNGRNAGLSEGVWGITAIESSLHVKKNVSKLVVGFLKKMVLQRMHFALRSA